YRKSSSLERLPAGFARVCGCTVVAIAVPCSSTLLFRCWNAAGDGRNDANRVAVLRGRVLFRQIANILVVHIHVDEAAQFAVLGEEVLAQVAKFRSQMPERFSDRSGIELG